MKPVPEPNSALFFLNLFEKKRADFSIETPLKTKGRRTVFGGRARVAGTITFSIADLHRPFPALSGNRGPCPIRENWQDNRE